MLGEALRQARATLASSSDSARLDAELLLAQVLGCTRTQLRLRDADELAPDDAARFDALLQRRLNNEPVAYLLGSQEFWSLTLEVGREVLVPRPETELLVDWALALLPRASTAVMADLGTGSGALALAIASERPHAEIHASDLSVDALAVARRNARRLDLAVQFHQGSWWDALPPALRFALVVSNPPYIAADDPHLGLLQHEPRLALSDEADGLQALRAIIIGAPARLEAGGWLLVEHGYDQGAAVRALFAAAGFTDIATRRDLEHRERCTGGRKP